MRIPISVSRSEIEKTIQFVDAGKLLIQRHRYGKIYEVRYLGRKYPPKFLVAETCRRLTGQPPKGLYGGKRPNNWLLKRGFDVFDKRTNKRFGFVAEDENVADVFPEGMPGYAIHRKIERNSKLAQRVKQKRLNETGDLSCEVCGFSFLHFYGQLGKPYIEAHHTIPISTYKRQQITSTSEIALVCANCHRMLHYYAEDLLSVSELRSIVKKTRFAANA